jgi:hypothetical protein
MRPLALLSVPLLTLTITAPALAQKKPPEPQGVTKLGTIKPDKGFIDDVFAFDGSGGRLAFVRTDASAYAEVEVIQIPEQNSLTRFDLSAATTTPTFIAFAGDGSQLFVVGHPADEEQSTGYLVDFNGKVLRKWGPATDVALTEVDGAQAVAVLNTKPNKNGGNTYEVQVFTLDKGKSLGKKRTFAADADGFVKSIDMTIQYWKNGYTQLIGKKKGAYDKLKDQRMNDGEAVYDVVDGSLLRNTPIADVIPYTKLMAIRAAHNNQTTFLHVPDDLKNLELVTADDKRVAVDLAEKFYMYDYTTLQWQLLRDGKFAFTLTVDPQNPDAVNNKRNDPELIDLYTFDPSAGTKATRVARLPKDGRRHSFQLSGTTWVVLRKHKGFGRGGGELELYTLTAK